MNVEKLKMVYRILEKSLVDEMIVQADDFKLRIKKGVGKKEERSVRKKTSEVVEEVPFSDAKQEVEDQSKNLDILSPQIGFFSRFNQKTKKQYVKLRDVVKTGDVIGTITSMHIEHQVTSEKEGKIVDFLVEEGQPVEYHQPLVRLVSDKERF